MLGLESSIALESVINLAFVPQSCGRYTEAFKLMEECISIQTQVLGGRHPFALSSLAILLGW